MEAYLESDPKPEREPPVTILVQFDRGSRTYEVTFEDDDEAEPVPYGPRAATRTSSRPSSGLASRVSDQWP